MDGHDEDGKPIMQYDEAYWGKDGQKVFSLGHSCDEWVIGDKKKALEFIAQLQELVDSVEEPTLVQEDTL